MSQLMAYSLRTISRQLIRLSSTKCSIAQNRVILTNDETTFVAWHPIEDFPYEYTKPLPEDTVTNTSVLKTQMTPEVMEIFNKKTPEQARLELMNITHTTKHRWFPRSRDKRKRKLPIDREYL
ncbi:hypothetical protein WA026_013018 [Henosepilachna vigintioctopunctata]|uniref:Large ribosomal subunit protein mL42 n=1 Tax=Henosepilachna vigintioctopunctata TaxID=420089 RepID=A0AAW1TT95_9CUCU